MALQTVFTAAQLTAIAASSGAKSTIPSAGQQGFHITNQSGAFVSVTDNFGSVIARIGPWLDMTGQIQLATTQLTFSVNSADPVQQIAGVGAGTWNVLCELLIDPQPIATTMLASALAGPIVPANSPAVITSVFASSLTRTNWGPAFDKPAKVFQFIASIAGIINVVANSAVSSTIAFGLVGSTSGTYLDFLFGFMNANNPAGVLGSCAYGTQGVAIYPFPLDLSTLLPFDTQVRYQTGISNVAMATAPIMQMF